MSTAVSQKQNVVGNAQSDGTLVQPINFVAQSTIEANQSSMVAPLSCEAFPLSSRLSGSKSLANRHTFGFQQLPQLAPQNAPEFHQHLNGDSTAPGLDPNVISVQATTNDQPPATPLSVVLPNFEP